MNLTTESSFPLFNVDSDPPFFCQLPL